MCTRNFEQVTKIIFYSEWLYKFDSTVVFILRKQLKATQMRQDTVQSLE